MLSNLLILVIVCSCSLEVTSGATLDAALTALHEFDSFSTFLMDNVSSIAQDQWQNLHDQLDAEKIAASKEIDDQVDNILGRVSKMVSNAMAADVDVSHCAETVSRDINGFASDMRDRLDDCYESMVTDGNAYLDVSWHKVIHEYATDFYCTNVSLVQCQLYEDGNQCYDFVIANIDRLKDKMATTFKVVQVEILNKMASLNFPCRQMIVQEMGLYPTLILEFASLCLAGPITQSVLTGC